MKRVPSFAKDDDSTLPKEPNGSKIGLGPKPIWGMSVILSHTVGLLVIAILTAIIARRVHLRYTVVAANAKTEEGEK